jgi:hypothetical protein
MRIGSLLLEIGKAVGEESRFKTAIGMISSTVHDMRVDVVTEETEDGFSQEGGDVLKIVGVRLAHEIHGGPSLKIVVRLPE